jgi:hypothetical protein
MTNIIHTSATPIKSRTSDSANFTGFVFAWLRQVDTDPQTSAMEFRLAYVISQMLSKKTHACFPLQTTLAERLGVKDRAVREYVSGLRDRGHLLVRHRGRDSSSLYEPILHDRHAGAGHDTGRPEDTCRSYEDDQSEDRQSDAVRAANSRRKTGTSVPGEPTSVINLNNQEERGAPKARRTTDSLKSCSSGSTQFLNSTLATIIDDDESGVALAPPPDRLQRGVEHTSKRTERRGLVIDQEGNPVSPPPKCRSDAGDKSNRERGLESLGGGQ